MKAGLTARLTGTVSLSTPRCLHLANPKLRRPAAIALAARALRAAGRKAKLKESSDG
jgi:hypothetical protein